MTQHTPGPWYEAKTGNHQGLIISEATGANIAVAYDKQDAPLIAAAPDLLAFARSFRQWHANHFEDFSSEINKQLLCLGNDAEAILAKVEG